METSGLAILLAPAAAGTASIVRHRAVGGNRAQAAAKLGIGTATLYRKIKEYGGEATTRAGK